MIQEYELSHPPQGKSIDKQNQFQPLMLVTMYRGLHAIDDGISLKGVSQYFSPFLFSIAIIGAFLAGRELGGNIAGGGSALFLTMMVGSIYWTKIGAFDREISLVFFGTWFFYLVAKVFRSEGFELAKYSIIAGLFYGLFLHTWTGALALAAVVGFALVLIILEKTVSGLGFILTSSVLIIAGHTISGFDISEFIGVLLLLPALARLAKDWESFEEIENKLYSSLKSNLSSILGLLGVMAAATVVAVALGGYNWNLWSSLFLDRIPGFLGMGDRKSVV